MNATRKRQREAARRRKERPISRVSFNPVKQIVSQCIARQFLSISIWPITSSRNVGTSEGCGVCTLQRPGDKIGSSGYVLKNTQLKVIDPTDSSGMYPLGPNQVGELLWKSPYVMTGYYENLQATRETLDKNG